MTRTPPSSTLITPENVVLGSMGVEWAASPAPDEIALRYIDPDSDWQYQTIRRRVPGATGPVVNTSTVTLRGVTSSGAGSQGGKSARGAPAISSATHHLGNGAGRLPDPARRCGMDDP